jgi:hypothetical protein
MSFLEMDQRYYPAGSDKYTVPAHHDTNTHTSKPMTSATQPDDTKDSPPEYSFPSSFSKPVYSPDSLHEPPPFTHEPFSNVSTLRVIHEHVDHPVTRKTRICGLDRMSFCIMGVSLSCLAIFLAGMIVLGVMRGGFVMKGMDIARASVMPSMTAMVRTERPPSALDLATSVTNVSTLLALSTPDTKGSEVQSVVGSTKSSTTSRTQTVTMVSEITTSRVQRSCKLAGAYPCQW